MSWSAGSGDRVILDACASVSKRLPQRWFSAERDEIQDATTTLLSIKRIDAGDRSKMDLRLSKLKTAGDSSSGTLRATLEYCSYRARPGIAGGFVVLTVCGADRGVGDRAEFLAERLALSDHADQPLAQMQAAVDRLEAGEPNPLVLTQRWFESPAPPPGVDPDAFVAVQDRAVAAYQSLDRPAEALRILRARDAAEPENPIMLYRLACLNARTRDLESAFELLARALRTAPPGSLPDPMTDRCFDRVRRDARFRAALAPSAP